MDAYKNLYNVLVRKVNEIIDTMEELEEFDEISFKFLNQTISDMRDKLEMGYTIDWDGLEEQLNKLEEDLNHLKGV